MSGSMHLIERYGVKRYFGDKVALIVYEDEHDKTFVFCPKCDTFAFFNGEKYECSCGWKNEDGQEFINAVIMAIKEMKFDSVSYVDDNEWKRRGDKDFVVTVGDIKARIYFFNGKWNGLFDAEDKATVEDRFKELIPDYVEIAERLECEFKEKHGWLEEGIV